MDMCLEKSNLINLRKERMTSTSITFTEIEQIFKHSHQKKTNKQAQIYSEANFHESLTDNVPSFSSLKKTFIYMEIISQTFMKICL